MTKRTWKTKLKLLWHALIGHPGAKPAGASLAYMCDYCDSLEKVSVRTNNIAAQLVSQEDIDLAKLKANTALLRGRTSVSFGTYNGQVMVYFTEFTLNIAMTDEQLEMFIAGLRAQQEKLKNETRAD